MVENTGRHYLLHILVLQSKDWMIFVIIEMLLLLPLLLDIPFFLQYINFYIHWKAFTCARSFFECFCKLCRDYNQINTKHYKNKENSQAPSIILLICIWIYSFIFPFTWIKKSALQSVHVCEVFQIFPNKVFLNLFYNFVWFLFLLLLQNSNFLASQ